LGAWNFGNEINGVENGAVNRDRRAIAVCRVNARTHPRQRIDDAAHRPAAQRPIAGERGNERMCGDDAGEHAHRAPRVAAIEWSGGFAEPAHTAA
jgi:hypothetical protein